jgi:Flp pilus assembly CpaE family ATPase
MQVVPLPLLTGDLRAALAGVALYLRPPVQDCRVIAVTGSAPGCGATTIASNIAAEIAFRFQRQTVLIELAQQMGVLATNLNVEPPCTLGDLLKDLDNLDSRLVSWSLARVADHFDLLAGSRGVGVEGSLPASGVMRVLDYVRRMARVVVLDVPCTFNDFQFEMLGAANEVVMVGEQSIASLTTLKSILAARKTEPGVHRIHVVLNRYDQYVEGLTAYDAEKLLRVRPIHTIPDNHAVILASVNEGKVLRDVNAHSPVVAAIDSLVDTLLEDKFRPSPPAGGSFFRRLFHAFRNEATPPPTTHAAAGRRRR